MAVEPNPLRGRTRTLTDVIKDRLELEIEAKRAILDSGVVLSSVHFLVTLDVRAGGIRKVVVRMEAGHD